MPFSAQTSEKYSPRTPRAFRSRLSASSRSFVATARTSATAQPPDGQRVAHPGGAFFHAIRPAEEPLPMTEQLAASDQGADVDHIHETVRARYAEAARA